VRSRYASVGDGPRVTKPQPHLVWGAPTMAQRSRLAQYIADNGPMSIYGDEGVYLALESRLAADYGCRYCVLTNTGTSALNSGYFGMGIRPGSLVVSANVYVSCDGDASPTPRR